MTTQQQITYKAKGGKALHGGVGRHDASDVGDGLLILVALVAVRRRVGNMVQRARVARVAVGTREVDGHHHAHEATASDL